MKQKLLYFLFSFSILFLSFPIANRNQQAAALGFDCNVLDTKFSYSPTKISGKTYFSLTIAHNGNLADGLYKVTVRDGNDAFGQAFKAKVEGGKDIVLKKLSPYKATENEVIQDITLKITLLGQGGSSLPGGRHCQDVIFVEPFIKGGEEGNKCDIQMVIKEDYNIGLKPTTDVMFKINNILDYGGDENTRRGVAFTDALSGHDDPSTCKKNSELSEGVRLTNLYSNRFGSGTYFLKILNGCTIADTPEPASGKLCEDFRVVIDPKGGSAGGLVKGSDCIPDNPDTEDENENECPSEAPYCIRDIKYPGHHICSEMMPIQEKCNSGECETALGNIPYDPVEFVRRILALVLSLAGGIFLLFTIISGYRLMVSQGDPEKVKEARESLVSALAGLLFIIFSLVILQFIVKDVLNLPGF